MLNARNAERLAAAARTLGHEDRIELVPGDIGNPETGVRMVDAALDRFGSVDVLINNAGIFGLKPFLENTAQDLDSYININLKGTYFVTQAVVRQFRRQAAGGSIVNIGTVLIAHPSASLPASAALVTKGGVHALTTSLASELAADNIRVNALLKRAGEVREITEAVLHLAGADYTTGIIMPVDGGYVHGRA